MATARSWIGTKALSAVWIPWALRGEGRRHGRNFSRDRRPRRSPASGRDSRGRSSANRSQPGSGAACRSSKGEEAGGFARNLPQIPRVEQKWVLEASAGAPVAAMLATEQASLQRMNTLDGLGTIEIKRQPHHLARWNVVSDGSTHQGFHVVRRVKRAPSVPVCPEKLLVRHERMAGGDMLGVVGVHVGVHPNPCAYQSSVILGARKRRQTEELHQVNRQLA